MASGRILLPCMPALDRNGNPVEGALLYFYENETTIPKDVYADIDLNTPLSNPVVADSAGVWPPIFADDAEFYSTAGFAPSLITLPGSTYDFVQATVSLAYPTTLTVSPFMLTVLDDADANEALDTLTAAKEAVVSRVALAALPSSLGTVYLAEGGRSGVFTWSGANLAAQVASDPAQGIYVAPLTAPTGASGAWVRDRPNGNLNPRWFGARADGASHPISGLFANLAAAQVFYPHATATTNEIDHLAITAALNFGHVIELGGGSYYIDREISLPSYTVVFGVGRYNTNITTTSATANVFYVNNYYTLIRGIEFKSTVTRTGGYAVVYDSGAANGNFSDFSIILFYQGIHVAGGATYNITDGEIVFTLAGGVSYRQSSGFAVRMRDVFMSNDPANRCFAHIALTNVADLTIDYVQTIYGTHSIYVSPGSGEEVDSLVVSNSFFDQPSVAALKLSGIGKFQRSSFQNTWFCAGSDGAIRLDTTAAAQTNGIKFTTCIVVPGPGATTVGVTVAGTNTRNTTLSNCSISSFTDGLVYSGCDGGLVVSGCRIGVTDGLSPNTNGINLVGAVDNYVITGNDLRGNLTAAIVGYVAAANKIAANNLT